MMPFDKNLVTWGSLLPAVAPAGLVAAGVVGVVNPGVRQRRALAASRAATVLAMLMACAGACLVFRYGRLASPLWGVGGIGFSFLLDRLSALMWGLIAFLGFIVVQFSRHYLDGDRRQGAFLGGLCFTLAGVTLFILAGNLFQVVLAWVATSLALHQLLLFYPDRPGAAYAARKKFIVARAGDLCLIGAVFFLIRAFATWDVAAILAHARALVPGNVPAGVKAAAVLIAMAAFLKSAQFPSHGWLPELMESPTPVSALLHAGIINGGTFLVVRLADVMVLSPSALNLLLMVGGFTALFAGAVMITQSSIKTSLAYSSVAHMGFMLFQCGLGAFPLAMVHLVAHSFYKAHAFLSSGTAVATARLYDRTQQRPAPSPRDQAAGLIMALGIYGLTSALVGVEVHLSAAVMVLGIIFVLGLTHMWVHAVAGGWSGSVIARIAMISLGTTLSFFFLEILAERVLGGLIPSARPFDGVGVGLASMWVAAFAAGTFLQLILPGRLHQPRWQAAYVALKNGLYVNTYVNRWIAATSWRPANHG